MLRELLPEFEIPHDPAEGAYYNADAFGFFLRDGITKGTLSQEDIDRAFAALNQIGIRDDIEIQNQLQVGILEILYDEWESYAAARQKLDGKALQLFDNVGRLLRTPAPRTGE